jgi:SAM-dependent methyltransferase
MSWPARTACSPEAFETMYRQSRDPWNFATSEYERGRYRAILDALLRGSYRRAFEPGCSIGELTARLACRCDRIVATDVAPSAVALARERCRADAAAGLRRRDPHSRAHVGALLAASWGLNAVLDQAGKRAGKSTPTQPTGQRLLA